tara:strand:+ start:10211 stop:10648 length:438 start_codon:yes stop_codon:yes gene_type:complete
VASYKSGKDGVLKMGGAIAAKTASWSYTNNVELLDTTALGDSDRRQDYGLRNGTGTCKIYYYFTNTSNKGDASVALNKVIKAAASGSAGKSDTINFSLGYKDGSTEYLLTFDAHISSAAITQAQGELMSADLTFQTDGPVTTMNL